VLNAYPVLYFLIEASGIGCKQPYTVNNPVGVCRGILVEYDPSISEDGSPMYRTEAYCI
jgi:hypothetical protein